MHWCLLTTHRVETLEQALQILQWDRWRWRIEQLFALLKQTGLGIEATQLESGQAIQSLEGGFPAACGVSSATKKAVSYLVRLRRGC